MPIPGSMVECRKCHGLCRVPGHGTTYTEADGVPAWKLTGSKRSRGFYCQRCFRVLGGLYKPTGNA